MPCGILLARGLLDRRRQLRLHQSRGALGDQRLEVDAVDDVERVDDVALGLGHLVAVLVADEAGDVDVAERHLAHELQAHHHHARDPEEDDVEAGDQHAGRDRSVASSRRALAASRASRTATAPRRTRCRARPRPGAARVLPGSWCLRAHLRLAAADVDVALRVVPGRDAMAPPQLAADAPVLDVAHPVEVGLASSSPGRSACGPARPPRSPAAASGAIFTYHWSVR